MKMFIELTSYKNESACTFSQICIHLAVADKTTLKYPMSLDSAPCAAHRVSLTELGSACILFKKTNPRMHFGVMAVSHFCGSFSVLTFRF